MIYTYISHTGSLWNEQQLNLELANLVRWLPDWYTSLALNAAHFGSPLIEAADFDHIWSTIALALKVLQRNVRTGKASVAGNNIV